MITEILLKPSNERTLEDRFVLLEYNYNNLLDKYHFIQLSLEGCINQNRIIGDDVEQALKICKILKSKIYEEENRKFRKERAERDAKLR